MTVDLELLCDDLLAEGHELAHLVDGLDAGGWALATPAPGWSLRDQVAHLARFDEAAACSIADPVRFEAERDAAGAVGDLVERAAAADRWRSGEEALAWFLEAREELAAVARAAEASRRVPWYGPAMTVASSLSARIMETWAHGQDVADALGVERVPSGRLRHVAFLCARAVPNSFSARGRPVPEGRVRLELVGPAGEAWSFGPEDAPDVVRGPALDLCLVATQRRHRADTTLVASGAVADEWLSIAQAFAGPPGPGRPPSGP